MRSLARPVLVVAERLDAAADMVVDQLYARNVPVMRLDVADFPQQVTLCARHGGQGPGWAGTLDDGRRTVRLEDIRAVYWRRPHRPRISDTVPDPYRIWARDQADAAALNVLAALDVRWINDPHHDRVASHKPPQLVAAARAGLRVPSSIITNDPSAARTFAKDVGGPLICKPILGGRLPGSTGRDLMIATHVADPDTFDTSIATTAHYFQERIEKAFEVRLIAVGGHLFAASLHTSSAQADVDWRTDYDHIAYGTCEIPQHVAAGVHRFLSAYGIVFGAFDFAVTHDDQWVFFENNPAGTWAWVENQTGLPIAAAHAHYLQGEPG